MGLLQIAGARKKLESVVVVVRLGQLRSLITGGAGFLGSHLVDNLMGGESYATVFDDLSVGSLGNVGTWLEDKRFKFVKGNLKRPEEVANVVEQVDLVFHLAANPEVRIGEADPKMHFEENLVATFNLLEAMRKSASAKNLVFASTSTVYGEAKAMPTYENYGPLIPISTYGASKLGCEALVCSYAYTFGLRVLILRIANIVGSRAGHGVIIDFIDKLKADSSRLEVLGDGTQKKSYLHVDDCVNAILHLTRKFLRSEDRVSIYNIGSLDQVAVRRIAQIVAEEMGLRDVKFVLTGGVDGGRGWLGDVKVMLLSAEKLLKTGWMPKYNSEQAVRLATQQILKSRRSG